MRRCLVGGVLIQLSGDLQQIVAFVSKKLTATARNWSTIEKEAFAMFYSVQKLQYYLFMKEFTLLTDHNNLLWMEYSTMPKIVKMRIFRQKLYCHPCERERQCLCRLALAYAPRSRPKYYWQLNIDALHNWSWRAEWCNLSTWSYESCIWWWTAG